MYIVYTYTYIHTYVCTYMHAYILTYIHKHMCERESESDVYLCIYIHTHVIYLDPAGGLYYQSTKIERLPCRLRARGTRGEGVLLHLSCPALSGCAQAPIYSRH